MSGCLRFVSSFSGRVRVVVDSSSTRRPLIKASVLLTEKINYNNKRTTDCAVPGYVSTSFGQVE